jgi:hypothetical protein
MSIDLKKINEYRKILDYQPISIESDEKLSEIDLLINNALFEYIENKNYKKAFDYFNKLVSLGVNEALANIGVCYYFGKYVKQDYKTAFEYYKKAESLGVNRALLEIGNCYYFGRYVDINYKMAFEYFKKAASLGVNKALIGIGNCYYVGRYVNIDYKKAFEYFKKASSLGVNKALIGIGNCYYLGHYVDIDHKKAFEYYKKAESLGVKESSIGIGNCYYYGYDIDYKKAFEYYKKHGFSIENIKIKFPDIPRYVYSDYEIKQLHKLIENQTEEIKLLKIDMQYAPYREHYNNTKDKHKKFVEKEDYCGL